MEGKKERTHGEWNKMVKWRMRKGEGTFRQRESLTKGKLD